MNGAWAVTAVLLVTMAAGCLDDEAPPVFATARDVLDRAQLQADAWAQDTVLYGVQGLEPGESIYEEGDDPDVSVLWRHVDPEVGDGRAQAWLYQFVSPHKPDRFLAVVVQGDRHIHAAIEGNAAGLGRSTEPSLGAWPLDSDAAVRAAGMDAAWSRALGEVPDALLTMNLVRPAGRDHPVWAMGLHHPATFFPLARALVDADDGAIVPPGELIPLLKQVGGAFEGHLTTQIMTAELHTFDVEDAGHGALHLRVRVDDPDPAGRLTVEVEAPGGVERVFHVENELALGEATPSTASLSIEDPAPGKWVVRVILDQGVDEAYELTWCAEGDLPGLGSNYCPGKPALMA